VKSDTKDTSMIRHETAGDRERLAHRALNDVRRRGPEAVEEETLRVRSELVRQYGWEGYQRIMARMEADLALLQGRFSASADTWEMTPRPNH